MRYSSFSLFSGGGFRVERYVLFTASLVLAACACLTFAFIFSFFQRGSAIRLTQPLLATTRNSGSLVLSMCTCLCGMISHGALGDGFE